MKSYKSPSIQPAGGSNDPVEVISLIKMGYAILAVAGVAALAAVAGVAVYGWKYLWCEPAWD